MELLIQHFAEVFIYVTAILASWGIFACHTILQMTLYAYQRRKMIRKIDTIYLIGLLTCTLFLLSCLFIFQEMASKYIIGIFVFEIWYTIFAVYFTIQYLNPCLLTYLDNKDQSTFKEKS